MFFFYVCELKQLYTFSFEYSQKVRLGDLTIHSEYNFIKYSDTLVAMNLNKIIKKDMIRKCFIRLNDLILVSF